MSSQPNRYLVRVYHPVETESQGPTGTPVLGVPSRAPSKPKMEEIILSYNTALDGSPGLSSWECAVHTAVRYQGTIYSEFDKGDVEFVRSYAQHTWWRERD